MHVWMNILCVETQCEIHYLVKELIYVYAAHPKNITLYYHSNIEWHPVSIYTQSVSNIVHARMQVKII